MHGVVGIWTMDEGRRPQQVQVLKERILPSVAASPGFVAGIWTRDPVTGKAHSMVVFENEKAATAFKAAVEANAQNQTQAGVSPELLSLVEVTAAEFPHQP
jgi:hypothetical protein